MANTHDLLLFRRHCNMDHMAQVTNPGAPKRSLHPEDRLLIQKLSLKSDSEIRAMYQAKLAINMDGVRARLAFDLRVWESVMDDIYHRKIKDSSKDRRDYHEAVILAIEIIPGRTVAGLFEPIAPAVKEASTPPLDDSDSSSYYACPSGEPRTPSENEGSPPNLSIESDGSSYYVCGSSGTNTPSGQQPNFDDDPDTFMFPQVDDPQPGSYYTLFPESLKFHDDIGLSIPPLPFPKVEDFLSPLVLTTLRPNEVPKKRKYDEIKDVEDTHTAVPVEKAHKAYGKDLEADKDAAPQ